MANILYVEDNPRDCELLCHELTGHHVTTVPRASDAVRLLDHSKFDLVIADVSLPDSVGDSTLRTLRQFAPVLLAISSVVPDIDTDIPFLTKESFSEIASKANQILTESQNSK